MAPVVSEARTLDRFIAPAQERLWALCDALAAVPGVTETVPGMNNCLVVIDSARLPHAEARSLLADLWANTKPRARDGKLVEIPTHYGGAQGEDLRQHGIAKTRLPSGTRSGFELYEGDQPNGGGLNGHWEWALEMLKQTATG